MSYLDEMGLVAICQLVVNSPLRCYARFRDSASAVFGLVWFRNCDENILAIYY